ncbi:cadherin-23-like [Aricia agestis]|uniref:cadherin-23-like n=1 Tax=Aricia agestis TaxID=91739 RepID=UPI001C207F77|nr:cadherin-23-like [Aricia agestis]
MELRAIITTVAILLAVTRSSHTQSTNRCLYMISIPREPKPNLPELDFTGLTWSERPFVPAPERDDVCMDEYYPLTPTSGTQIIFMEEEIEGDVAIAKLNYEGSATPEVVRPLVAGSFVMLGPEIRREDDGWYLYITNRQDYETPGMQVYMFNVRIDGETLVAQVSLQIVNIDDNDPIIHVLDPCVVPELDDSTLTSCIYNVTDEDGQISTIAMTFEIESTRNDDEIFYMQGDLIPGEWNRMYMTVGLNQALNFETNALHIFRVTALDSLPNTHTVTMMVQVENVEHRPPRWVEIFAVQQFDEKTSQTFTIRAIDGDTGIDKPIEYSLSIAEEDRQYFNVTTIEGGRSGAILQVHPIDRDELERELFQMTITAYKYDNEELATQTNIAIIINDINDQIPEPLHEVYTVTIDEETPQTLNFEQDFGFHDRDLGSHAQYQVHLESVYPPGAAAAFFIQPEIGYQRQTFIMGTTNHSMLDFEVPEFQNIELKVIATDLNNTDFVGVATVYINLRNWNDELPIFQNSVHTVTFDETVGKDFFVGTMLAEDRDIDDRVEHTLMGNAQDYLTIDKTTGDITVSIDEAFDYHRQNELLIQIRADDTLGEPYNTATSQLVIRLNDINNTPPTLRLPRGSPHVEENVPEGYQIIQDNQEIQATDPDTTAELQFEIVWDSSYATKQGRNTDPVEYHRCIEIQTIYPDPSNRGAAIGRLVVKEIRHNVTIDYEEFEVLFLTVRVVDVNTAIGQDYDELTYTITIIDMNDNPPIFNYGTLQQSFRVRENSASNTIIGSVQATDIDGPLYNQIRYTIMPRDDTPEGLIKIDFNSGQIEVDANGEIDADDPPRYNLYYTVIASDKCSEPNPEDCPPDETYWDTPGNITIEIIDTNNKVPFERTDKFNVTVYIYENATTGDEVVVLASSDLDRDEIYHTVSYQINYGVNPRLRDFFSVNLETGLVYVDYTTEEVLDRDGDEPTHQLFFNLIDNFYSEGDGNRNLNTSEVLVVLLDVNDNAPELPPPDELSWSISEGLLADTRILPEIYAPDRDEPGTDNWLVGYAILNLTITNRDIEVPELFRMIQIQPGNSIDPNTGELETAMDLRGYWGTYAIGIFAYDHGIPQMDSNEIYEIVIRPYNFHHPVFVFPQNGARIRLFRERTVALGRLVLVNGEFLDPVQATDEDGLEAGIVTFSIVGNAEAQEYFTIDNNVENEGNLMLKDVFPETTREFYVTIRATDHGTEPQSLSSDVTIHVVFVPTQGEPEFTTNTASVAFVENEEGLTERHQLPLASDPKNYLCEDDCRDIYYSIIGGNEDGYFAIDKVNNILYLARELDRNEADTHVLRIAASSSESPDVTLASSTLTVTVTVREANPRPYFDRALYTAGISTSDNINRELLTVRATHSEGARIEYTIDMSTMVEDPSLSHVRETAFVLGGESGILTLNIQPTSTMHGIFQFDVVATDTANQIDRTEVKIYLISSQNRVYFTFYNPVDQVIAEADFIAQTFGIGFDMTCNIDQVVQASDSNGVGIDDMTEVRAHFIQDDLPVETERIEDLRSDTQLLRTVQRTLETRLLVLTDFVTGQSPVIGSDPRVLTVYVLAGLTVLLGFLCLVLFLALVIRTRRMNRRLEALSMTKYGSQESGLNRAGLAAPGTNKHAVEGSNPIWNETIKAPDFDALSDISDDSDLIGIENLPQFRLDYDPQEDKSVQNKPVEDQIADHSNNFAFNPTPFSPQFANSASSRN